MTKNIAINNIKRITAQLNSLFNNATVYASSRGFEQKAFGTMELVNNSTWWAGFKFSDYLSNVASYMRMGPMLGRER
jgi:tyrosyl-tRNA synthetase